MSKDYITLHKEQSERIDDFRNSLIISDFNNDEVVDYHTKWFNTIIEKGKELGDIGDDLVNDRLNKK